MTLQIYICYHIRHKVANTARHVKKGVYYEPYYFKSISLHYFKQYFLSDILFISAHYMKIGPVTLCPSHPTLDGLSGHVDALAWRSEGP